MLGLCELGGSASLHQRMQWCCHHTLCHIEVGPWKPVGSKKTGVHVDAVLDGNALLARPHSLDSQRKSTDRIKHATECLELPLDIVLLALEFGDGELGGMSVCDWSRGRPRRDGGRVEVAHDSTNSGKPIPDKKRPVSSSSSDNQNMVCILRAGLGRDCDQPATNDAFGIWHARRGVAPRHLCLLLNAQLPYCVQERGRLQPMDGGVRC